MTVVATVIDGKALSPEQINALATESPAESRRKALRRRVISTDYLADLQLITNPDLRGRYIKAAVDALQCQDACNLSGVAYSFSSYLKTLWDVSNLLTAIPESSQPGYGTAWVNQHPIIRLFVNKLADLSLSGACWSDNCAGDCEALVEILTHIQGESSIS